MKRLNLLFGFIALAIVAGCNREGDLVTPSPDYDPETNTVKTQFVLSVSTEVDQDTKTTAEFVQHNKPFLGMEAAHILAYNLDYTSAEHGSFFYQPIVGGTPVAALRDYNLGTLFPANAVDADNASRVLELSFPLGTNAVLVYGKALKSYSDDLQGKVEISGDPANITTLEFSLTPRLTNQAAFDAGAFLFSHMLSSFALSGLVNEVTFWNNPTGTEDKSYGFWWPTPTATHSAELPANPADGDSFTTVDNTDYKYYAGQLSWKQLGTMYDYEYDIIATTLSGEVVTTTNGTKMGLYPLGEVLGNAYSSLTTIRQSGTQKELRAGCASGVLRAMQDLYAIVERCAAATATGWEENVAKLLAEQIKERMDAFFAYRNGELDFLRNSNGTVNIAGLKASLEAVCSPDRWNANKSIINTYLAESYFSSDSNPGFPVNVGLPKGAAILACNHTADLRSVDQFSYLTDIPAYGMGDASFPINNYRYPAELLYFGNSAIRTSAEAKSKDSYPSSITAWDTEGQWTGWDSFSSVQSSTRSVAMINNINYGTALLASTVSFGGTTLKDNNHALHPSEEDNSIPVSYTDADKGIFVTGIIVGGQADVMGFDFTRQPTSIDAAGVAYNSATKKFTGMSFTDNAFDKMIYDKVLDTYKVGSTTTPIYTMVWDNYDHTLAADDQADVYVGVELVNNTDQDFWGEMNLIRKGGTFYLLGKLDLSDALAAARAANASAFTDLDRPYYCYPPYNPADGATINAPRVFMQDYITNANLILGTDCLKHAYVTLPDLRSSQISLGVSIDMSWSTGLTFNVEMGNTD